MATEVYTADDIKLQDGTEVTLIPLPIRKLRAFMRRWTDFTEFVQKNGEKPESKQVSEFELGEAQFECFADLLVICLGAALQGDRSDEEFKEYVLDTVDEHTIYRVLDKCGGLKLNDPNLLAAAMAQMNQAAGETSN